MSVEETERDERENEENEPETGSAEPPPRPGKAVPRSRMVLNIVATMLLSILLLVMVNYLANRHYARGDWTRTGFRKLSDKTVQVLTGLEQDVDVVVFLSMGTRHYTELKEILTRYEARSRHLSVEFVDPDVNPTRFRVLQKKYRVASVQGEWSETSEQIVVVRSGDDTKVLNVSDFTEIDFGDDLYFQGDAELKGFKAEEYLTSAILFVTSGEKTTVCFATGHGEWEVQDWGETGLGTATEFLRRDNFEVESFDLRERQDVPEDCMVVVVAAPERPVPERDVQKLDRYLRGGGNLLFFLEPIIDGDEILPTGLEPLLETVGVDVTNAVALEGNINRIYPGGGRETFVSMDHGTHPITKPIIAFPSLWLVARPLQIIEGSQASPVPLVRTSEEAWGERHLGEWETDEGVKKDDADIEGPLLLGAASQLPPSMMSAEAIPEGETEVQGGRVVVFGDVHLLAAGLVDNLTMVDRELFVGSVAWLTARENLIAIPPKEMDIYDPSSMTLGSIGFMALWVLLTVPGIVLVAGIFMWIRRRR